MTLAPWKKSYDHPRQHIQKQRHCFVNKGLSLKGYGFSSSHVWMWELDYKAEPWGSDVFGLRCWRRLLTVPWTAKSSNQSTLKEISPEYSLEGLRLRLKLQYFDHLLKTNRLLGKDLGRLKADREEDDRGWDHWMASLTWWPWVWVRSRCWWWTGKPGMLQSMGSQGVRIDWVTKLNWIN